MIFPTEPSLCEGTKTKKNRPWCVSTHFGPSHVLPTCGFVSKSNTSQAKDCGVPLVSNQKNHEMVGVFSSKRMKVPQVSTPKTGSRTPFLCFFPRPLTSPRGRRPGKGLTQGPGEVGHLEAARVALKAKGPTSLQKSGDWRLSGLFRMADRKEKKISSVFPELFWTVMICKILSRRFL